ncbi:hypothetical protein TNCV_494301 [Trichonephila clavipes]|nr:hypothetical protein TNCV_494301 [Trichonephila clavipes]
MVTKDHLVEFSAKRRHPAEHLPLRLFERHFVDEIIPTEKKTNPTRQDIICYSKIDITGKKVHCECFTVHEMDILRDTEFHDNPSFLPSWLDSPGWLLAFSRNFFQASLLPASVIQFLVLKTRKSFSRPSILLRLDLSFLCVPIG